MIWAAYIVVALVVGAAAWWWADHELDTSDDIPFSRQMKALENMEDEARRWR